MQWSFGLKVDKNVVTNIGLIRLFPRRCPKTNWQLQNDRDKIAWKNYLFHVKFFMNSSIIFSWNSNAFAKFSFNRNKISCMKF